MRKRWYLDNLCLHSSISHEFPGLRRKQWEDHSEHRTDGCTEFHGITKCIRKVTLGRLWRNYLRRRTIKSDLGGLGSNCVISVKWSFSLTEFWQLCLRSSFLLWIEIYSQQLPLNDSLKQYFSDLKVHMNQLRILLNYRSRRSRGGGGYGVEGGEGKFCLSNKVPDDADTPGPQPTLWIARL